MSILSKLGNIAKFAAPIAASFALPGIGGPLASGAMGLFGKVAGAAPGILSALGAGTSAAAGSSANNRGVELDARFGEESARQGRERLRQTDDANAISAGGLNRQATDDYHTQMRLRDQEGRAGRAQGMRDLQIANYVANRGPQEPVVTTSGKTLNTMGLGARESTDQEKAGMQAAAKEIMMRLEGGNQLPTPKQPTAFQMPSARQPKLYDEQFGLDPKLLKPGLLEKIGGIVGPALTGFGNIPVSNKRPMDENPEGVTTWNPTPFLGRG